MEFLLKGDWIWDCMMDFTGVKIGDTFSGDYFFYDVDGNDVEEMIVHASAPTGSISNAVFSYDKSGKQVWFLYATSNATDKLMISDDTYGLVLRQEDGNEIYDVAVDVDGLDVNVYNFSYGKNEDPPEGGTWKEAKRDGNFSCGLPALNSISGTEVTVKNGEYAFYIPSSWVLHYVTDSISENIIRVCNKENYEGYNNAGCLFTIQFMDDMKTEKDLEQIPVRYDYLGTWSDGVIAALYPSDVQFNPEDNDMRLWYQFMYAQTPLIVESFHKK